MACNQQIDQDTADANDSKADQVRDDALAYLTVTAEMSEQSPHIGSLGLPGRSYPASVVRLA